MGFNLGPPMYFFSSFHSLKKLIPMIILFSICSRLQTGSLFSLVFKQFEAPSIPSVKCFASQSFLFLFSLLNWSTQQNTKWLMHKSGCSKVTPRAAEIHFAQTKESFCILRWRRKDDDDQLSLQSAAFKRWSKQFVVYIKFQRLRDLSSLLIDGSYFSSASFKSIKLPG